jgi:hypothetical protein
MQSRYGSDDSGRCYVAVSSYILKDNVYKESARYLYDGQTDDLLAFADIKNAGAKDEVRRGMIFDPEYTVKIVDLMGYEVADNYIASKVGRP